MTQPTVPAPSFQPPTLSVPAVARPAVPTQVSVTAPEAQTSPDSLTTATPTAQGQVPAQELRFFFFSDSHSRSEQIDQLRWKTQIERPDFVIDGGDIVHDGTAPELERAANLRKTFPVPVHVITGNHDAKLRGPFAQPPTQIPDFQHFEARGVQFILLDNQAETLSESQFNQLEDTLKKNAGQPTIVALHVPPKLSKEPLSVKLGKLLPIDLASPVMKDKAQVERLHRLMDQYNVAAVLAGHTHYPDEVVEDGVRYITVGSSGGLAPKPGIGKEYLDIRVSGEHVDVQRITLAEGKKLPGYAAESLDFYRDLNNFNHEALGWKSFYPSANVGYQAGFRRVETARGVSVAATAGLQAERLTGERGKGAAFAAMGISAGTGDHWDLGLQGALGYKQAVYGDYNRGVYLSGAATVNAGYLHGAASAGAGLKAAVGAQYQNWTLELGQEWSTNSRAQYLTAGFRF